MDTAISRRRPRLADEPLLVVSEPIVFVGIRHALEHLLRIDEVEFMLSEIPPSFWLTPCNHQCNVYTLCILVKGGLCGARIDGQGSHFRSVAVAATRLGERSRVKMFTARRA